MPDDAQPSLMNRVTSRFKFSLAAVVASFVGAFLLCVALGAWLVYSIDPSRIAWGDYMTIGRGLGLFMLWGLSCGVTYITVRIWMSETPPGDPRVRDGWNAGMKLLSHHSIRLKELPCFVVLGCETRHQQDALLGSDGFTTAQTAAGVMPAIDWHVTEERILIFCRDIGVYGGLLRSGNKLASDQKTPTQTHLTHLPTREQSNSDIADSEIEDDAAERPDSQDDDALQSGRGSSATVVASPRVAPTPAQTKSVASSSLTGVSAMQTLDHARSLVLDAQSVTPQPAPARSIPNSLSSTKTTAYQEQLGQLCARLRAERFPYAPINGTLVIVAADTINDSGSIQGETGRAIGRAIRSDLDQLQAELGIASPVTIMVADNDHADDYRELQRRFRMLEQETSAPLGSAFVSEEIPTVDAMNELANDALRMIESRVKHVFQIPRSLTQPENHRLVRVLIQCRRWRCSLRRLLVESCAFNSIASGLNPDESFSANEPQIVSGLFVASASGGSKRGTSKSGSFVEPVIDRMVEQQNHLAWTTRERKQWQRHHQVVGTIMALTGILLVMLLVQIWRATQA